jgi:hypothetical protein
VRADNIQIVRDLMKARPKHSLLLLRRRAGKREGLRPEEEWALLLTDLYDPEDLRTQLDLDEAGVRAVLALGDHADDLRDLMDAKEIDYVEDDYDTDDAWR